MAINILTETIIDLEVAAKRLLGRDGGPASRAAMVKWSRRGKRGVRLETVMLGARRVTSVEAIARFVDQLTRVSEVAQ